MIYYLFFFSFLLSFPFLLLFFLNIHHSSSGSFCILVFRGNVLTKHSHTCLPMLCFPNQLTALRLKWELIGCWGMSLYHLSLSSVHIDASEFLLYELVRRAKLFYVKYFSFVTLFLKAYKSWLKGEVCFVYFRKDTVWKMQLFLYNNKMFLLFSRL